MRIHIGVGSGNERKFVGVQYAHNDVLIYDDKNYTYTEAHP